MARFPRGMRPRFHTTKLREDHAVQEWPLLLLCSFEEKEEKTCGDFANSFFAVYFLTFFLVLIWVQLFSYQRVIGIPKLFILKPIPYTCPEGWADFGIVGIFQNSTSPKKDSVRYAKSISKKLVFGPKSQKGKGLQFLYFFPFKKKLLRY